MKGQNNRKIEVVQLEGLVLLRILKHCRDNVPNVVTGQLLGIDVEDRLEVASCFPSFSTSGGDAELQEEKMKTCLRRVNVDSHIVGWYRSAFLGNFVTREVIEHQFEYQKDIPNSVFIVFDPSRTTAGRLALKAFRLTDRFFQLFQKGELGQTAFAKAGLTTEDIFEEVPIKVHNSHLIHAFLYELRESKSMSCDFDRLQLCSAPELCESLDLMSSSIDDLSKEHNNFQYMQRKANRQTQDQQTYLAKRNQENAQRVASGKAALPPEDLSRLSLFKPLPEADRLNSMLTSHQINQYCGHIGSLASMGFNKIFITQGFHDSEQTARR